ncbi:MAG TPA: cell envelope biogenesis protein OmpA [Flavobacteriia bacterium]|nr:cell envelope biogenesis protein OmpA [Flavobacteriia bacterium]
MLKKIFAVIFIASLLGSCVSKKKYLELEQNLTDTKGQLQKTTIEKEDLEAKFAVISKRVEEYNSKINSLRQETSVLKEENDKKMEVVDADGTVMSKEMRSRLNSTLSKLSPEELAGAQTLKDSLNLAIAYKLNKSIKESNLNDDSDINVNIDKTVVMITVADSLLFRTASYRVSPKAASFLQKLADVINSEPSMDVMVEGHTDSRSIHTEKIDDNWDLSVKRATSIVRILQNKYKVDPARLIPSGRSSYVPLASNDNRKNRARNRRTNIIIMPNINKFFALLADEEVVKL